MSTLKKGDRVMIYNNPVTETNPEGQATLVRRVRKSRFRGECDRWLVRFDGDDLGAEYERFVLPTTTICILCDQGVAIRK